MSKSISLKEITAENWREIISLELHEEQKDYLAGNVYSLAESKFNPYAVPKAIYLEEKVIGFLMYDSMEVENAPHEYVIYRFMIDKKYQRKGYGRIALKLAMDEIKQDIELKKIRICYAPENTVSRHLYAASGFKEVGIDEDGEMIAEISFANDEV